MLREKDKPEFFFDPDAYQDLFEPLERPEDADVYEPVEYRIIAPVSDKSHGIQSLFIQASARKALELAATCSSITAIGYSFPPSDQPSYGKIVDLIADRRVPFTIVGPSAVDAAARLSDEHGVRPIVRSMTLSDWIKDKFRLI